MMFKAKPGFAPIETFVISVVLGIVGVTAFGQFQDLSAGQARTAVLGPDAKTVSAAAINYAARILEPASVALASGSTGECGDDIVVGHGTTPASDYDDGRYGADDAATTCR